MKRHSFCLTLGIVWSIFAANTQRASGFDSVAGAVVDPVASPLVLSAMADGVSREITIAELVNVAAFKDENFLVAGSVESTRAAGIRAALDSKATMAIFATVAALRANTDAVLQTALVRNHSVAEDQGGGRFVKVGGGGKADDNGAVIVDANSAVWIREEFLRNRNETTPVWWGAIAYFNFFYGPATPYPSPSPADASAAFQAANDALPKAHPESGRGGYQTITGRHYRTGKIRVPTGQFWLGTTVYLSPTVRFSGDGFMKTFLIRMPDTAPLAGGERFVIESEELVLGINNNNFGNVIEHMSVNGYCSPANPNGNEAVSCVRWRGAQGSYVRDVHFSNAGKRCLVNHGCVVEDAWLEGAVRGPAYHDFTGGYGVVHKNLSVEHNNLAGIHTLASEGYANATLGDGGLRVPSVIVETATHIKFDRIQFEQSPFDMLLRNTSYCEIENMLGNAPAGSDTVGIVIRGDSHNNSFKRIQSGIWGRTIVDESFVSLSRGEQGEIPLWSVNKTAPPVNLPFLNPNEQDFIRCQGDHFLRGDTTSGNIGDFGWESKLTGPIGFNTSNNPGGRAVCIATGAVANNTSCLTKDMGGDGSHKRAAVTFTLNFHPEKDANAPFTDAKIWMGWANNADPDLATEYFKVGWDTSSHGNIIVKQRVKGGFDVTTDTGTARPTGYTYWAPEFICTIIGPDFNLKSLKGCHRYRVIIYYNPKSHAVKLLDREFDDLGALASSRLFMQVTTLAEQAKSMTAQRVEIFSAGGTQFGYH